MQRQSQASLGKLPHGRQWSRVREADCVPHAIVLRIENRSQGKRLHVRSGSGAPDLDYFPDKETSFLLLA